MTAIRAAKLFPPAIPTRAISDLCVDFVDGFCRAGDTCTKSHEICEILTQAIKEPLAELQPNTLALHPRIVPKNQPFDHDAPGVLSANGARHDNDFVDIHKIRVLPTTDEILSERRPFMPMKNQLDHYLPMGEARLLDTQFRQLRYENTEAIIDACYHAAQELLRTMRKPHHLDYDSAQVTPQGVRYSLFRDVSFEDIGFHERHGITARLSFACPKVLRGRRILTSGHFERGRLTAIVGLDPKSNELSTIFMEVDICQSTDAMRPRTGNDLRGKLLDGTPTYPLRSDILQLQQY